MKKYFYVALMCLSSMILFNACNQNAPGDEGKKVNYDQMIGSWKLTSYSVLWKNLDDDLVEKELNYSDGYLVIEKKKTDDGDAYFYKENFADESRAEYEGMLEIDSKNNQVYFRAEDEALMQSVLTGETDTKPRMEFLAPLDPMLWDKQLIALLWGFQYSWEIYTPAEKRKYGYYTLPILWGEDFIGRIEAAVDRKSGVLLVKNIWYEPGVRQTKKLADMLL